MSDPILPWLQSAWNSLYEREQAGKLPHALLIEGVAGIGKREFALFVARAFLCTARSMQGACGKCAACTLLVSQSHPDLSEIQLIDESAVIKIDQIREMVAWLQLTKQYQGYKVALVSPADALNRNAANSLLKTLEEPSPDSLIMLLAEQRGLLPATVVSRCQRINLTLDDKGVALNWLESQGIETPELALALANGGPLLAASSMLGELSDIRLRLFRVWQDIVLGKASVAKCVEALADIPTRHCLTLLCIWVSDSARLQVNAKADIRHPDLRRDLTTLGSKLPCEKWFTLYDQLLYLYRTDSASIKTQTVLEGIFADIRLNQIQTS